MKYKKYSIIYNSYGIGGNPWFIEHQYLTLATYSEIVKAKNTEEARDKFLKECEEINYRAEIIDIREVST